MLKLIKATFDAKIIATLLLSSITVAANSVVLTVAKFLKKIIR
jgi:hypothetical protein